MSTSEKTLDNFGIHSFNDLLEFRPNQKYKSQMKLSDELYNKMFSRSKKQLLCALNFKDLSETLLNKIVSHYEI